MLGAMRTLTAMTIMLACGACGADDAPAQRPLDFGGARPVSLQVPTGFDEARAYPLLLVLHGYSVNGFLQQSYFRLGDAADAHQTLVLAPEGTRDSNGNQFWNADPACCDFDRTGVDDVAYLGGLIDEVMATWPIDPARVTVVGHSNGAFMAYRLACDRADVVTAIAGLAGHAASAGTACAPTEPVHVLHLHGTLDETIPYETVVLQGVASPGAVDSVAAWAAHNGCAGGPAPGDRKDLDSSLPGAETAVTVTSRCPAAGAAELWTIEGGTHIPSPAPTLPTELMAWFAAHAR